MHAYRRNQVGDYSDGGTSSADADNSRQHRPSRESYQSSGNIQRQHQSEESYQGSDNLQQNHRPKDLYQSSDHEQKPQESCPSSLQQQHPPRESDQSCTKQKHPPQESYQSSDHLQQQHQPQKTSHLQQQHKPPKSCPSSDHLPPQPAPVTVTPLKGYAAKDDSSLINKVGPDQLPPVIDHSKDVHPSSSNHIIEASDKNIRRAKVKTKSPSCCG
ncbi:hypothetical protein V6N13_096950 [Hibiscus sabdariffa]|uniref:Uncharacterized protein n=2 Tax=Hibiscus sabdariffa TaxID=183260 RepID=A0ABR2PFH4_9ROSI